MVPSLPSDKRGVQRLGKNINGYFGERIDIAAWLGDCMAAGRGHGWSVEEISAAPKPNLLALTRHATSALPGTAAENELGRRNDTVEDEHITKYSPQIYISSGIHGDEPAGPLAM